MAQARSRFDILIVALTALLILIGIVMVFGVAPTADRLSGGDVQRIFYFHVGIAWVAGLALFVTFVSSILYLARREQRKFDIVAAASVEIGVVFGVMVLLSGMLWARPVWNTWWTWDPRLTSAAVTELIYIAYFMLRQGMDEPEKRARFGAVYTLLGGLSAPITFFVIRLFRTIHPVVIGNGSPSAEGGFDMTPDMLTAFLFALFAFTVIFIDLIWHRIRLGDLQEKVDQLKFKVSM